jgi:tetratricopeptide (TPR) repeat protein/ferredoxin
MVAKTRQKSPAAAASKRADGGCSVAVDPSHCNLPILGQGATPKIRPSSRSRRRAGILLGVHLVVAAHIAHFLTSGRTLSPVEPSESMYTLELGYINAGCLFFAAALLGTVAFGRFFCGWGCHLVALQDLCAWMLRRLGIRPRPFRSRLLALGPFVLMFYMFIYPIIGRAWTKGLRSIHPGFTNHMTTADFWATFPGPAMAAATLLVCGFATVYVLGAKGFCTYGCPYGALFGLADRLSPFRILVSDACEGCGHCTATCTSNVLVHKEVKLHGMVVDPGCMKCMDCVSVCPKDALHLGLATPPLLAGRRPAPKRYDASWPEELALAAIALAATLSFRGLYDGPPLLLAVALGGLTAFAVLKAGRLVLDRSVQFQNIVMKTAGRLRPAGWAFAAMVALWTALTLHGAFVQWQRALGNHSLEQTDVTWSDVLAGAPLDRAYSARHQAAATRAYNAFATADRWGLIGVVEVKLGLAWIEILRGDLVTAEGHLREAVSLQPRASGPHRHLVEYLVWQGRPNDAIRELEQKRNATGLAAREEFQLANLLVEANRPDEAIVHYLTCTELAPDFVGARYNVGGLFRRLGRNREAIEQLRIAKQVAPEDPETNIELGLAYAAAGDHGRALASLRHAQRINPDIDSIVGHSIQTIIAELEKDSGP